MAEAEDGFLKRWSRRKEALRDARVAEEAAHEETVAPAQPLDSAATLPAEAGEAAERSEEEILASLPDIDSLDRSSDFTVFMQKGVPAELRRLALRKLWRVDPIFGLRDGLNDYDLDYKAMDAAVAGVVNTAYQVGKGMPGPAPKDESEDELPDETAEAGTESDAEPAPEEEAETATAAEPAAPESEPTWTDEESGLPLPAQRTGPASDKGTQATLPNRERQSLTPTPGSAAARRWSRFTT